MYISRVLFIFDGAISMLRDYESDKSRKKNLLNTIFNQNRHRIRIKVRFMTFVSPIVNLFITWY